MPSSRDKCFRDALDAYNENFDDDPYAGCSVKHEPHYREHPETGEFWETGTTAYMKEWIRLQLKPGKSLEFGPLRSPDMVLTCPDGKTYVVDNKFSRDRWRKYKGGKKQIEEYKKIQERHRGKDGFVDGAEGDPSATTPEACDCEAKGASDPIQVPQAAKVPGENWFPIIIPELLPELGPLPTWVPTPTFVPAW
jgi:hypothetical protein